MNITDAIDIIESIAGVTDESTPAGEAWDVILKYICNPAPQPLVNCKAEASLIELRSTVMGLGQMGMFVAAQRVERAADLLQRQHPQPVAVSERLPGPEDCDEQGRCWMFDEQLGLPSWTLIRVQGERLAPDMYWRPFNALPIPQGADV